MIGLCALRWMLHPKRIAVGSAALVSVGLLAWTWRRSRNSSIARRLRQKAIAKRTKEQEYISSQLDSLSRELDADKVEKIIQVSAPALLQKLKDGDLTPLEVLKIYLYQACRVTGPTNSVTEIVRKCQDVAVDLNRNNSAALPLYGLPVSLKECMETKGAPATGGLAIQLENIAKDDCVLSKVLEHCGAVPFVKTNVCQMMLSYESSNPIYGETSNPLNSKFNPGGSSSGEGALIGAGGSLLGFGTDIGGSIRAPCHFCGICGLKPTKNRISAVGIIGSLPGQSAISAAPGPMARDVDTLVLAMRAILCDYMFQLDQQVVPIKFREELYASRRPLRIGFYYDDGYMKPVPACQRAVRITKEALEKAGHTLIPFKFPDIEWLINMAFRVSFADGGRGNMQRLEHDVKDKCVQLYLRKWKMHGITRKISAFLASFQSSRVAADLMIHGGDDRSAANLWRFSAQIEAYKEKFWREWKEKYHFDAMITPAFSMPACPKGTLYESFAWISYCFPYTVLNCPAGIVTVTRVTEKDIEKLEQHSGHYGDKWDKICKEASRGSVNMPVGVQCISSPWNEEVCLRLMKEVETLRVK